MKGRGAVRALASFAVLLVLGFSAVSVDARGRGGGGGGRGGGGFSRGGAASSGSFRTPRPSTRPSYSRPSTYPSQRPTAQPGRPSVPARPSAEPARPTPQPGQGPAERPGERPAERPDRDDAREDWQQHREDIQDDRQEYAKKAREDWQEYAEWDEYHGYWVGGWYGPMVYDDDVDDWAVFVAGIAIGTALSSAAYHSMQSETKCQPTEVIVDQITYMKCGNNWYNRVMQGGSVSYVVVAAPPGF